MIASAGRPAIVLTPTKPMLLLELWLWEMLLLPRTKQMSFELLFIIIRGVNLINPHFPLGATRSMQSDRISFFVLFADGRGVFFYPRCRSILQFLFTA